MGGCTIRPGTRLMQPLAKSASARSTTSRFTTSPLDLQGLLEDLPLQEVVRQQGAHELEQVSASRGELDEHRRMLRVQAALLARVADRDLEPTGAWIAKPRARGTPQALGPV